MVTQPFLKLIVEHLPTGVRAITESFSRGTSAARAKERLMPLVQSRIARHGEQGPPPLVRTYDLTGDDAKAAQHVLDGSLPYPEREA